MNNMTPEQRIDLSEETKREMREEPKFDFDSVLKDMGKINKMLYGINPFEQDVF